MPTHPRTREQRYERCLKDLASRISERLEEIDRFEARRHTQHSPNLNLLRRCLTRITRTLTPRPITTQQIHRLLSKP